MIAFIELEANQTVSGSFYRVRLGYFVHPKVAAMMLALTRWF